MPPPLILKFAPEGNINLSDDSRVAVYKWVTDPSKAWVFKLLGDRKIKLYVKGYASKTGSEVANWETYAKGRADNTKVALLVKLTGLADRIQTETMGPDPASNAGPDADARRVEVFFEQAEVDAASG